MTCQDGSKISVMKAGRFNFSEYGSLLLFHAFSKSFRQSFSDMSVWTRSMHRRLSTSAVVLIRLHCLLVI